MLFAPLWGQSVTRTVSQPLVFFGELRGCLFWLRGIASRFYAVLVSKLVPTVSSPLKNVGLLSEL
jgi:hypothetical protein